MKMEKIGKMMMIVFMFGLLTVPVFSLTLVPDVQAAPNPVTSDGLTMPDQSSVGYEGTETDIVVIVKKIVKWVVGFIVLLSIFMFAYGGLIYLTAGGDESKVDKAKTALTAALFGLLIAALAYAIVNLIIGFTSA